MLRMLVRLFARMSLASFHDGRRMSEQTVANADARRPPNIREADADQPQRWS
ncbi:hypothetical protein SGL43_02125 [Streptomyces globisporus]|uniref:Integrase n=1 Tax=Streptomyces globisporus TaxID=1908 RepID=A0ABM9GX00_STRGL|nr:hypothetical protein SGL43_02125 [Streptomyces globisporus]